MAIKAIIEKLEDAPEALRGEYRPGKADEGAEGKYVLDVEGVGGFALENVSGLKSALGAERTRRETLERDVVKYKDIDPDRAREALAKLAELGNLDPASEADKIANTKFEAAKAQLLEKHQQELGSLNERNGYLTKTVDNLLREQRATAAIAAQKGNVEVLLPHILGATRTVEKDEKFVVEVIDKAGNIRIADSMGTPMDLDGLVAEMRESKTFAANFEGGGHQGSGKQPDGYRPANKGDFGGSPEERKAAIAAKYGLKE